MTYRELLLLYKKGELDEETRRNIEKDIEKQDAISEYLFDEAEIPVIDDINGGEAPAVDDDGEDRFVAVIRRSIRRAFLKMGIVLGCVMLGIVLFTVFLLPRVVSMFYYDPTEVVIEHTDHMMEKNRMSLDLAVYSELFLPGYFRDVVIAESEGYGEYAITIPQVVSYNSRFTAVNGRLVRDKLTLYNTNILKLPTGNAFALPGSVHDPFYRWRDEDGEAIGPAGSKADAFERVKELSDENFYVAYVSLEEIMDYGDFYEWFMEMNLTCGDVWCAVYTEDPDGKFLTPNVHVGFSLHLAGVASAYDYEEYPYLALFDGSAEPADLADFDVMKGHFVSLISYLRDHERIVDLMDGMMVDYDGVIDSVVKDGLRVYGVAVVARKDAILKLTENPMVSYVYTDVLY